MTPNGDGEQSRLADDQDVLHARDCINAGHPDPCETGCRPPRVPTPSPAPDPDCRYCSGRGWVVGGDEVRDCYCRGLVATDLTEETSALRGRRDAARYE